MKVMGSLTAIRRRYVDDLPGPVSTIPNLHLANGRETTESP